MLQKPGILLNLMNFLVEFDKEIFMCNPSSVKYTKNCIPFFLSHKKKSQNISNT